MRRYRAVFLFCYFLCLSSFRAGAQHRGCYPSSPPVHIAKMRWCFQTVGRIISSPAAADGFVYFGSADHNVYSVDANSGTQHWKFDAGAGVNSSPAIEGGVVAK